MKTQLFTLSFFLIAGPVFSQIFVKSDASGANDGTSWTDAYTQLTDAMQVAPPDSEIWVAAGTYRAGDEGADPLTTHFYFGKKLLLYGGFAGTETSIDQRDIAANPTILSGDISGDDIPDDFVTNRSDNGLHVIFMEFLEADGSVVDGFRIEGGSARYGDIPGGQDATEWFGGGVLSQASFELRNCHFQQNGGAHGSAVFTLQGAVVAVENCVFEKNASETGTLRMANHFQANVTGCHFENNKALYIGGAATIGNTNVRFEGCAFANNTVLGNTAGAVYVFQNIYTNVSDPLVEFRDCVFSENQASIAAALAFGNSLIGSQFVMEDCLFDGNEAGGQFGVGGALVLQNNAGPGGVPTSMDASIRRCVFENNVAVEAPGILALSEGFDLFLVMDSCLFAANVSQNNAAGMQLLTNEAGFIESDLDHLVFTGNTSGFAGGALLISNGNTAKPITYTLRNSLFDINSTQGLGGAVALNSGDAASIPGPIGSIEGCAFLANAAEGCCGAIFAEGTELQLRESYFQGNSTASLLAGGGAIGMTQYRETLIETSTFLANSSGEAVGAAFVFIDGQDTVMLDNVAIAANDGASSIYNEGVLTMRNVTLFENSAGLLLLDGAELALQNCILADDGPNLLAASEGMVNSLGGNLSDDASMTSLLPGHAGHDDLNDTDPLLDTDLVPTMSSPCVDAGNPDGIAPAATDALGNARFQGSAIDIGALESPFLVSPVFDPALDASVEVFPNPFSGVLNIQSEQQASAVRLYDVYGRLVEVLPAGQAQITVGGALDSGVYFLEMEFKEGVVRRKVVRE